MFCIFSFAVLSLFPLLTLYLLWKLKDTPEERLEKYPALVATYRPECWYYEVY